jgi:hypothetical protein
MNCSRNSQIVPVIINILCKIQGSHGGEDACDCSFDAVSSCRRLPPFRRNWCEVSGGSFSQTSAAINRTTRSHNREAHSRQKVVTMVFCALTPCRLVSLHLQSWRCIQYVSPKRPNTSFHGFKTQKNTIVTSSPWASVILGRNCR